MSRSPSSQADLITERGSQVRLSWFPAWCSHWLPARWRGSYLSSPPLSFLIYKVDTMLISTSHAFCENLRLLACGKLWLVVGAWSAWRVTCCCCGCCDLWLLLWVNLFQSQSPACGPSSSLTTRLSSPHAVNTASSLLPERYVTCFPLPGNICNF